MRRSRQMRVLLSPAEAAAVDAARALRGESQSDAVARWAREACEANSDDPACAEALLGLAADDATPRSRAGRPPALPQRAAAEEPPSEKPQAARKAAVVANESREGEHRDGGLTGASGEVRPRYCRSCRTFLGVLGSGARTRCRGCGREVEIGG